METIALISISTLRKLGLFDTPLSTVELPTAIGTITAVYDESRSIVSLSRVDDQAQLGAPIQIELADLSFGQRRYFVCPQTIRPCLALICKEGETFCPRAYFKGRAPLSKRRRREQVRRAARIDWLVAATLSGKTPRESLHELQELQELTHGLSFPSEPREQIEKARLQADKASRKQAWDRRPLGTIKALDCGRGAGQFAIFERYIERPPQFYISTVPEPIHLSETPPATVAGFPALSFAAFALRIEAIKTLIQSFFRALPSVDAAANTVGGERGRGLIHPASPARRSEGVPPSIRRIVGRTSGYL